MSITSGKGGLHEKEGEIHRMVVIDLNLNLGQLINGALQAGVNAGVILLVSHSLQKALIKSNSEREQKEEKDKKEHE